MRLPIDRLCETARLLSQSRSVFVVGFYLQQKAGKCIPALAPNDRVFSPWATQPHLRENTVARMR